MNRDTTTYGGNGGLSMRHKSAILRVLAENPARKYMAPFEDSWLVNRMRRIPELKLKMANATVGRGFSVEGDKADKPMGFHIGWGGKRLLDGVWDDAQYRKEVYSYCPEIKMVLDLDLTRDQKDVENGERCMKAKAGQVSYIKMLEADKVEMDQKLKEAQEAAEKAAADLNEAQTKENALVAK
jgi:Protein of unknown function (DUF5672)